MAKYENKALERPGKAAGKMMMKVDLSKKPKKVVDRDYDKK